MCRTLGNCRGETRPRPAHNKKKAPRSARRSLPRTADLDYRLKRVHVQTSFRHGREEATIQTLVTTHPATQVRPGPGERRIVDVPSQTTPPCSNVHTGVSAK